MLPGFPPQREEHGAVVKEMFFPTHFFLLVSRPSWPAFEMLLFGIIEHVRNSTAYRGPLICYHGVREAINFPPCHNARFGSASVSAAVSEKHAAQDVFSAN